MNAVTFFRWFVDLMTTGIKYSYSLLDRIYIFTGVTVLDFVVASVVISVVIPVFFTIAQSGVRNAKSEIRREKYKKTKKGG